MRGSSGNAPAPHFKRLYGPSITHPLAASYGLGNPGRMDGDRRILAIETSGRHGSVATLCGGVDGSRLIHQIALGGEQRTAQALAPAIQSLLRESDWSPSSVELVAVAVGPGSFTGLRIGVTTAKAFAYAVGAEVIGINTLVALAHQSPALNGPLWAVLDAQRQELFAAKFVRDDVATTAHRTTNVHYSAKRLVGGAHARGRCHRHRIDSNGRTNSEGHSNRLYRTSGNRWRKPSVMLPGSSTGQESATTFGNYCRNIIARAPPRKKSHCDQRRGAFACITRISRPRTIRKLRRPLRRCPLRCEQPIQTTLRIGYTANTHRVRASPKTSGQTFVCRCDSRTANR